MDRYPIRSSALEEKILLTASTRSEEGQDVSERVDDVEPTDLKMTRGAQEFIADRVER